MSNFNDVNHAGHQTRHQSHDVMFRVTSVDLYLIGMWLEGLFYGLYSGIFAIYLQHQVSKKDTNKTQSVIFYSICLLYVFSVALFVSEIVGLMFQTVVPRPSLDTLLHINIIQVTSFGCGDFIAQFILIYRCWIVWGRNVRVVIIPSILAFAFWVIWLVGGNSIHIISNKLASPHWLASMALLSLALSLTVNSLVTGLIIFRIFKVFREVRATSDDQILGATGGNKLRSIIFILIESGMTLFSIQLVRFVLSAVNAGTHTFSLGPTLTIITGIHEMLTGITPTIILVRTSMGLSFDDEKSVEEVAIGSLRFASSHPNSVPEMGSINIVDQDRRDDDDIAIRASTDIEVVDRRT